jgi:hypothetical protein
MLAREQPSHCWKNPMHLKQDDVFEVSEGDQWFERNKDYLEQYVSVR